MQPLIRRFVPCWALCLALGATNLLESTGHSAIIIQSLGQKDFNEGDVIEIDAYQTAAAGELAPFDDYYGTDSNSGNSFNESWSFSGYGALSDPILSASVLFGIFDHDSAAAGDQVALFEIEGVDLTATLNTKFEATGGSSQGRRGEYNMYAVSLPVETYSVLSDGDATFSLTLQNGAAQGGVRTNNGAGLDFATLSIITLEALRGDFNGSNSVDDADIDLLTAAIRDGSTDLMFDLDGSNVIDEADLDTMILDVLGTHYGDADLDSAVTASQDGAILLAGLAGLAGEPGWADADFDADLNVTASGDGALLLANLGADSATAVPEPSSALIATLMAILLATCCPKKRFDSGDVEV